jgi:iron complex transport system substrate-binding protein
MINPSMALPPYENLSLASPIVDATGAELCLRQPAQRIVCLTASGLDTLAELGLEPVGYLAAGVAANPEFYGERAKAFAPVGSWMVPNVQAIRHLQPDLILGWRFPHQFWRWRLRSIAPLYLMAGHGQGAVLQRLQDIAQLTDRPAAANQAISQFQHTLASYQQQIPTERRKTILLMGGSQINILRRTFIVETDAGPFASVLKQVTHYPWAEPPSNWEHGFTSLSLSQILAIDPAVIFVQSYPIAHWRRPLSQQLASHPTWQQLTAVQTGQVYEIDTFWHGGSGTRMLRQILNQLMPKVYPQLNRFSIEE